MAKDDTMVLELRLRLDKAEKQLASFVRKAERTTLNLKGINHKKFTQPLGKITGSVSEFQKSLEASNARVIAFSASAGILMGVTKAFQEMAKATVEVEKSLKDINVIMGASSRNLQKFGASLFDIASKTGQSFFEVSKAATEFARQGLSMEKTLTRTRDALILTRLSGMDAAASVNALTAAINSFSSSALTSTEIINRLANVDAAFAVSTTDLAEAIRRVGSSADSVNVSFNEMIAVVTSVQQTTARGGNVIGNSLKTIFTRIQRTEVIDQMKRLGVVVKDTQGNMRPAMKVLSDFAKVYDKLNPTLKASTAELIGGVYQMNILKAMLKDLKSGYSVYSNALDVANNSTDEAIKRNQELNKTLSALINESLQNLTGMGAAIGKFTLEPLFKRVLEGFNSLKKDINIFGDIGEFLGFKAEDGSKFGGELADNILKSFGNILSGPGFVALGTIIGKLFLDFVRFLGKSVQDFANLNKNAQKQAALQEQIKATLSANPALIDSIVKKEQTREQVERKILDALKEEIILRERIEKISGGSGARAQALGFNAKINKSSGETKLTYSGKSKGHIPNFSNMKEYLGALQGGYKPGDIKQMHLRGAGKVTYNSAEQVKKFPGMQQEAIMPPEESRAGKKYSKRFEDKHGFDPYASKGFVPNLLNVLTSMRTAFDKKGAGSTGSMGDMLSASREQLMKSQGVPAWLQGVLGSALRPNEMVRIKTMGQLSGVTSRERSGFSRGTGYAGHLKGGQMESALAGRPGNFSWKQRFASPGGKGTLGKMPVDLGTKSKTGRNYPVESKPELKTKQIGQIFLKTLYESNSGSLKQLRSRLQQKADAGDPTAGAHLDKLQSVIGRETLNRGKEISKYSAGNVNSLSDFNSQVGFDSKNAIAGLKEKQRGLDVFAGGHIPNFIKYQLGQKLPKGRGAGGRHLAVRDQNMGIHWDPAARFHADLVKKSGLEGKTMDGGWLHPNGRYEKIQGHDGSGMQAMGFVPNFKGGGKRRLSKQEKKNYAGGRDFENWVGGVIGEAPGYNTAVDFQKGSWNLDSPQAKKALFNPSLYSAGGVADAHAAKTGAGHSAGQNIAKLITHYKMGIEDMRPYGGVYDLSKAKGKAPNYTEIIGNGADRSSKTQTTRFKTLKDSHSRAYNTLMKNALASFDDKTLQATFNQDAVKRGASGGFIPNFRTSLIRGGSMKNQTGRAGQGLDRHNRNYLGKINTFEDLEEVLAQNMGGNRLGFMSTTRDTAAGRSLTESFSKGTNESPMRGLGSLDKKAVRGGSGVFGFDIKNIMTKAKLQRFKSKAMVKYGFDDAQAEEYVIQKIFKIAGMEKSGTMSKYFGKGSQGKAVGFDYSNWYGKNSSIGFTGFGDENAAGEVGVAMFGHEKRASNALSKRRRMSGGFVPNFARMGPSTQKAMAGKGQRGMAIRKAEKKDHQVGLAGAWISAVTRGQDVGRTMGLGRGGTESRATMPQLSKTAQSQFEGDLAGRGVSIMDGLEPVANLKATQKDIYGSNVLSKLKGAFGADKWSKAGLGISAKMPDWLSKAILVSQDNKILDGHHRWATVYARDAIEDNRLGNLKMKTRRIGLPIQELLGLADSYSGAKQGGGGTGASGGFVPNFSALDDAMKTERSMGGDPALDYDPSLGFFVRDKKTQSGISDVRRDHPEGLGRAGKNSKKMQDMLASQGHVPNYAEGTTGIDMTVITSGLSMMSFALIDAKNSLSETAEGAKTFQEELENSVQASKDATEAKKKADEDYEKARTAQKDDRSGKTRKDLQGKGAEVTQAKSDAEARATATAEKKIGDKDAKGNVRKRSKDGSLNRSAMTKDDKKAFDLSHKRSKASSQKRIKALEAEEKAIRAGIQARKKSTDAAKSVAKAKTKEAASAEASAKGKRKGAAKWNAENRLTGQKGITEDGQTVGGNKGKGNRLGRSMQKMSMPLMMAAPMIGGIARSAVGDSAGAQGAVQGLETATTFASMGAMAGPKGAAVGAALGIIVGGAQALSAAKDPMAELTKNVEQATEKLTNFTNASATYLTALDAFEQGMMSENISEEELYKREKGMQEAMLALPDDAKKAMASAGGDAEKIKKVFQDMGKDLLETQRIMQRQKEFEGEMDEERGWFVNKVRGLGLHDQKADRVFGEGKAGQKRLKSFTEGVSREFDTEILETKGGKASASAIQDLVKTMGTDMDHAELMKFTQHLKDLGIPEEYLDQMERVNLNTKDGAVAAKALADKLGLSMDAMKAHARLAAHTAKVKAVADAHRKTLAKLKSAQELVNMTMSENLKIERRRIDLMHELGRSQEALILDLATANAKAGANRASNFQGKTEKIDTTMNLKAAANSAKSIADTRKAITKGTAAGFDIISQEFSKANEQLASSLGSARETDAQQSILNKINQNQKIQAELAPLIEDHLDKMRKSDGKQIDTSQFAQKLEAAYKKAGIDNAELSAALVGRKLEGNNLAVIGELAKITDKAEKQRILLEQQRDLQKRTAQLQEQIAGFGGASAYMSGENNFQGFNNTIDKFDKAMASFVKAEFSGGRRGIAPGGGSLTDGTNSVALGRAALGIADYMTNTAAMRGPEGSRMTSEVMPFAGAAVKGQKDNIVAHLNRMEQQINMYTDGNNPELKKRFNEARKGAGGQAINQIAAQLKIDSMPEDIAKMRRAMTDLNEIIRSQGDDLFRNNKQAMFEAMVLAGMTETKIVGGIDKSNRAVGYASIKDNSRVGKNVSDSVKSSAGVGAKATGEASKINSDQFDYSRRFDHDLASEDVTATITGTRGINKTNVAGFGLVAGSIRDLIALQAGVKQSNLDRTIKDTVLSSEGKTANKAAGATLDVNKDSGRIAGSISGVDVDEIFNTDGSYTKKFKDKVFGGQSTGVEKFKQDSPTRTGKKGGFGVGGLVGFSKKDWEIEREESMKMLGLQRGKDGLWSSSQEEWREKGKGGFRENLAGMQGGRNFETLLPELTKKLRAHQVSGANRKLGADNKTGAQRLEDVLESGATTKELMKVREQYLELAELELKGVISPIDKVKKENMKRVLDQVDKARRGLSVQRQDPGDYSFSELSNVDQNMILGGSKTGSENMGKVSYESAGGLKKALAANYNRYLADMKKLKKKPKGHIAGRTMNGRSVGKITKDTKFEDWLKRKKGLSYSSGVDPDLSGSSFGIGWGKRGEGMGGSELEQIDASKSQQQLLLYQARMGTMSKKDREKAEERFTPAKRAQNAQSMWKSNNLRTQNWTRVGGASLEKSEQALAAANRISGASQFAPSRAEGSRKIGDAGVINGGLTNYEDFRGTRVGYGAMTNDQRSALLKEGVLSDSETAFGDWNVAWDESTNMGGEDKEKAQDALFDKALTQSLKLKKFEQDHGKAMGFNYRANIARAGMGKDLSLGSGILGLGEKMLGGGEEGLEVGMTGDIYTHEDGKKTENVDRKKLQANIDAMKEIGKMDIGDMTSRLGVSQQEAEKLKLEAKKFQEVNAYLLIATKQSQKVGELRRQFGEALVKDGALTVDFAAKRIGLMSASITKEKQTIQNIQNSIEEFDYFRSQKALEVAQQMDAKLGDGTGTKFQDRIKNKQSSGDKRARIKLHREKTKAELKAGKEGEYQVADSLKDMVSQWSYSSEQMAEDGDEALMQVGATFRTETQDAFGHLINGTKDAKEAFGDLFQAVGDMIQAKIIEMAIDRYIMNPLSSLGGARDGGLVAQGKVQKFALGGVVRGGSGVRDDVPAMLSNGEFVVKKSSVNKYGMSFLNSLNSNVPPISSSSDPQAQLDSLMLDKSNRRGAYAKFNLRNAFIYDSDKPGAGSGYAIDNRLSRQGLTDEDNSRNQFRMDKVANLFDYWSQRTKEIEDWKKSVQDWKTKKRKSRQRAMWMMGAMAIAGSLFGDEGSGFGTKGGSKKTVWGKGKEAWGNYKTKRANNAPQFFGRAEGGLAGRDNVPSMLMGGEYVVNSDAVSRYGVDFFKELNSGRLRNMAEGGYVGSESVAEARGTSTPGLNQAGGNNISITVNIDQNGGVTGDAGGLDKEKGSRLAEMIQRQVTSTIIQEKRQGGILRG